MSDKATVLVLKKTGHVLGAVTRVGDPEGELEPASLAGTAFPVVDGGSGDPLVDVSVEELDVEVVPFIADLFLQPQSCAVEGEEARTATLLSETTTVALAADKVTITLSSNAPEDMAVWVQVQSRSGTPREPTILEGEIPSGQATVDIDRTFSSGEYDVLALVPGYLPGVLADKALP